MAIGIAAMLMILAASPAQAQTPRFRVVAITPLNINSATLPHMDANVDVYGAMSINNYGEVVYGRKDGSAMHAWVWLPEANRFGFTTAGLHDLTALSGEAGIARDINSDGIVVGQAGAGQYQLPGEEACAWILASGDATFRGFGFLDGALQWSGANAVNNDDPPLVTGQAGAEGNCECPWTVSDPEITNPIAFKVELEDPQGPLISLGSVGGNASMGNGVSDSALTTEPEIAGLSNCDADKFLCDLFPGSCDSDHQANTWGGVSPGVLDDLSSNGSSARGSSENGHLAGWSYDSVAFSCKRHAIYWETPDSDEVDLNVFMPSGQSSHAARAEGVNNWEMAAVVGQNEALDRGLLWEQVSSTNWLGTDLNDEIACSTRWAVQFAHDVNDDGWIAAIADDITDPEHPVRYAVVLIPFAECPTDKNCDGVVGTDELLLVINNWGSCPPSGPCPGDFNDDGTVDSDDLLIVVNNWGICDAGESSAMGGGGSGEQDIWETIQELPGLPPEVLEMIQELLGL